MQQNSNQQAQEHRPFREYGLVQKLADSLSKLHLNYTSEQKIKMEFDLIPRLHRDHKYFQWKQIDCIYYSLKQWYLGLTIQCSTKSRAIIEEGYLAIFDNQLKMQFINRMHKNAIIKIGEINQNLIMCTHDRLVHVKGNLDLQFKTKGNIYLINQKSIFVLSPWCVIYTYNTYGQLVHVLSFCLMDKITLDNESTYYQSFLLRQTINLDENFISKLVKNKFLISDLSSNKLIRKIKIPNVVEIRDNYLRLQKYIYYKSTNNKQYRLDLTTLDIVSLYQEYLPLDVLMYMIYLVQIMQIFAKIILNYALMNYKLYNVFILLIYLLLDQYYLHVRVYIQMQKIINGLKLFDTFGVALNLKVDSDNQYYKTVYGAFITLLIYSISLMYAVNIMIQWQTYQISPKMSQTPFISPLSVDLEYDVIDICYWIYKIGLIDPFQQQNNILIPLLQMVDSHGNATYISLLNQTVIGKTQSIITLNSGINIYDQNGNISDSITRTVLIVSCQDQFLNSGEYCASELEIQQFFNQPQNLLIITINSRLLDIENTPQNALYTTYFYLEPSLMYTFNADLKTSTYHIKNQLFTDAGTSEEYLSGQIAYGQSNTIEFSKQAFAGLSAYGALYITLQPLQTLVVLEYPHIGELLAQIGSVVSLLFIFKYFIAQMNYDYMWQNVVDQIISYYYPQFTEIKIEYNCLKTIKSAKFRNQQFDVQKFRIFHKQLSDRIKTKMTFNNIIYELSRLYMIIRSIQSQVEIRKSHNVGIEFDILRLQRRNCVVESDHNCNPNGFLNDDDVDLISLSSRFKYKDLIEDSVHLPSRLNPFYELNILNAEL